MGAKKDLSVSFSSLTQEDVEAFCLEWGIGLKFKLVAPGCDKSIDQCPSDSIAMYCRQFEFSNLRHTFSNFVLNVLEYYHVSFGQIHPQGLARVLHSEVLCRSLGFDPSLLSFHRFFRLAKNGDWFTFDTTKVDKCLVSSMVTTLGAWKDRFFWVSDSIVHFKMVWRQPEAVLNEPEPSEFELNSCFLVAIRKCPLRVRPFPEHLLVLLGISKLWDKSNRDPVFMRDGQVMSSLDFVKSDDTSDVVFAVARGSEQRFEVSSYVSVPNVKGFTKVPTPKVSTRWSNRRLLKGADQPSGSEAIDISDDIVMSAEQGSEGGVEKEKEKELVVTRKKKKLVKKVAVPAIQGSSGKSVEGLEESSADEIYVPNWGVKVGDSFKDPAVCADVLANFAPPSVRDSISEMEGDTMISRMILSNCNLSALLAEGVTRFRKGMQEYEEFTKKKDKMKASIASMKKEIDGFAKKEEAWVKKMHEVTSRHEVEVEGLKKELEVLKVQEKTSLEEQERLKASEVRLVDDNRWLIEHGFQQVVTYLLHSSECNHVFGAVYTKLLAHGRYQGLVVGYKACEAGEPQDKSPLFQPQALKVFQDSVRDMEHMNWPFVGEVSECFDKPLSILQGLKPRDLNEVVCKKVLEFLSKKRSCSGDSEETMSAGGETSKEGSLEASEAASEGRKKKKAKKSKDDGAASSLKPSRLLGVA
ncbi:hypothetical protein HanIR_Chr04g0188121 [Helianthus annuus]|nr:hypothetical protein HanIR_Chr04g0188121 [Helianthus annuus]